MTIPTSVNDITIGKYIEYKTFMESHDEVSAEDAAIKTVSIFCDIPLGVAEAMTYNDIVEINDRIHEVFSEEAKQLHPIINLGGVSYGFIPNMEEISFGAMIDLDDLLQDDLMLHHVMAVLYRPVVKAKLIKRLYKKIRTLFWQDEGFVCDDSTLYEIEPYRESNKYADAMLDMPLDVALGALGFISHLGDELLKSVVDSLKEEPQTEELTQHLRTLEENGVGMDKSVSLLRI